MTNLANHASLYLDDSEAAALVGGYHGNPFAVLGPHLYDLGEAGSFLVVRTLQPFAKEMRLIAGEESYPMVRVHNDGLFQVALERQAQDLKYKLVSTDYDTNSTEFFDPYAFGQTLSEFDLHLIKEGTHFHTYNKLGAHVREMDG